MASFSINSASFSSSPWAADPWDAIGDERPRLEPEPEYRLNVADVAIPMSEAERAAMPTEAEILQDYEDRLRRRSARHMGYPYNLDYDHDELHRFLRYTINNLGDPFVTSNYGVHAREFECAVIDFFAGLWKIDPGE